MRTQATVVSMIGSLVAGCAAADSVESGSASQDPQPAPTSETASSPASIPRDLSTGTHVVLLGTGTPNPDPEASGPATAIVVDGAAYIVDTGPGVVRRAASAAAKSSTWRRFAGRSGMCC